MIKILFVCHGNICRSPMAEFVFKKLINDAGLNKKYYCDSRACTDEENGRGIYPAAARELFRRGIKMGEHEARRMSMAEYREFDLIVSMDDENLWHLNRMTKGDPEKKVHLLMDYTDTPGEVMDPWYSRDFERTYDDILEGCVCLLKALEEGKA